MENLLLFAYFGENDKGIEGKMHTSCQHPKNTATKSRKDCAA
jgi:hypothetical protein